MNNLSKEEIFKNVNDLVEKGELKTVNDLCEHLVELKNRGILTKAQSDELYSKLSELYDEKDNNEEHRRIITRTPQSRDFENSDSAGFSQVAFLVVNILTLTLAVVMINLLNK